MNKASFFNKLKSPIAKRMLITILISSSIITFFIIAIQIFFEYKIDVKNIENRINQIESSYTKSLALSVWNFNKNQYNTQLDGILNLEDIVYVEILAPNNEKIISKGEFKRKMVIRKEFLLETVDFNKKVVSGKLIVLASLKQVYADLYDRVFIILFTQGIKTLLISLIILWTFHIFVSRHLFVISSYARGIDFNHNNKLVLDKKNTNDELDDIVFRLNDMQDKIKEGKKELENLNTTLEKKVSEKTKELKFLALIDPMTKLYNRRYFSEISEHIFNVAKRNKSNISTIMIDIDHFKRVNDTYGHHFGDTVLIKLANILTNLTRKTDIVCRWGGEEFLIILESTSTDGAHHIAEKIRREVENLVLRYYDTTTFKFTISLGISEVDFDHDMNIEVAINRADRTLYEAKNSGRNKVCCH